MSKLAKSAKCINCGNIFHPWNSSLGKYCCNGCQRQHQNKVSVGEWLAGKINPINSNGLLRPWARKHLFEIKGKKCELCGWGEINAYTGSIPLEVDHINGKFKDNVISNLRLLCPNCHSLTSTYKNSNKGNGRRGRK